MPGEAFLAYRHERMRWLVGVGVLLAAIMGVIAAAAFVSSFAWPHADLGDPNALINAGRITDFEVNEPVFFQDARLWLVRRADGSFVAFSAPRPLSRLYLRPERNEGLRAEPAEPRYPPGPGNRAAGHRPCC